VVVGREHASILFPQELVLVGFWHGAQMECWGVGAIVSGPYNLSLRPL
jgi:hypothetical protein